jgi:hypothetical protein
VNAAALGTPSRSRLGGAVVLAGLALALAACGGDGHGERLYPPREGEPPPAGPVDAMVFETPPPPFSDPDIFPCSGCHDATLPPNPKRRTLSMAHEDIVLHHDEEHRWCLDCHDAENRDRLRLANGTLVKFEESYRLCGQCHGDKYRDWRAGVHGRRTGQWDGKKQYLLCVHCHYSHAPRFAPLAPKPAPVRPENVR